MNPQPLPYAPPRRKRRVWPWILLVVILLGFGGCMAAVASVSNSVNKAATVIATSGVPIVKPSAPPAAHVGATLRVTTSDGVAAVTLASTSAAAPGPLSSGPEWALTVNVQSITGTINVNPLYWAARTTDGRELTPDLAGVANQLATTDVTPGQMVSGQVGFVVPDGQSVTTVLYKGPLGGQLGVWTVP